MNTQICDGYTVFCDTFMVPLYEFISHCPLVEITDRYQGLVWPYTYENLVGPWRCVGRYDAVILFCLISKCIFQLCRLVWGCALFLVLSVVMCSSTYSLIECCFIIMTVITVIEIFMAIFYFEATDCPCGVWCHGLTYGLLYVGPLLGILVWMIACL